MRDRLLIVNADDFGRSPGINAGVARAHEQGIVTSASLMVRWPAAREAAAYARRTASLGVGLHVDLAEWRHAASGWVQVYERVDADRVEQEVRDQLELFRSVVGRDPTHLDSHQHVHREEPVRSVVAALSGELGVPARELAPGVVYQGSFYGQTGSGDALPEAIAVAALVELLASCGDGVTELGCHPAAAADFGSAYATERIAELDALCSHEARAAVLGQGIRLVSFRDVAGRVSA